jgi:hypothetical protein
MMISTEIAVGEDSTTQAVCPPNDAVFQPVNTPSAAKALVIESRLPDPLTLMAALGPVEA